MDRLVYYANLHKPLYPELFNALELVDRVAQYNRFPYTRLINYEQDIIRIITTI